MASSGDDYHNIEPSIALIGRQEEDVPALYDIYLRDRSPISQQQEESLDEEQHEMSGAASASNTDWRAQSANYDDSRYGWSSQDYQYHPPEDSPYPDQYQASAMPSLEGSMQGLRFHDPQGSQLQSQEEYSGEPLHQGRDPDSQYSPGVSGLLFTRIPSTRKSRKRGPKSWEFLYRLLSNPEYNPSLIRWEDTSTATFRLVQPETIAQMWGARNEQPNLSYNNFARSLRYHYKSGILTQVSDRQLVYRFGELALENLRSSKN